MSIFHYITFYRLNNDQTADENSWGVQPYRSSLIGIIIGHYIYSLLISIQEKGDVR